jgi:putative membrane protein
MEVRQDNMSDNNQSDRIRQIAGWGIIGLIVAIGVSIVLSLYFAPWRPGGFSSHFFFPFHFGWLGTVFLIFIVIFIARWFFGPRRGGREEGYYSFPQQQRPDATSIVKERSAKGEITKEQFDQMMGDLRQHEGG